MEPDLVQVVPGAEGIEAEETAAETETAVKFLIRERGYRKLTANQRKVIVAAFALEGQTLLLQSFDLVKSTPSNLDLSNLNAVSQAIKGRTIEIIEVKSVSKKSIDRHLCNLFFSVQYGQVLSAQSLGSLYKFVFFHKATNQVEEMTLNQILSRAKTLHISWSINFGSLDGHANGH